MRKQLPGILGVFYEAGQGAFLRQKSTLSCFVENTSRASKSSMFCCWNTGIPSRAKAENSGFPLYWSNSKSP
jgi:hypothetical protein